MFKIFSNPKTLVSHQSSFWLEIILGLIHNTCVVCTRATCSNTFATLTLTKGSGKAGRGPMLGFPIGEQQSWSPVSGRSNLFVGFKFSDLISSSNIPSLSLWLQKEQAFLQLLPQMCMRDRACLLPFI